MIFPIIRASYFVEDRVFGFTTSFTPHHSNPLTDVPRHRSRHVSRHRSLICQDIVHPRGGWAGMLRYDIHAQQSDRASNH